VCKSSPMITLFRGSSRNSVKESSDRAYTSHSLVARGLLLLATFGVGAGLANAYVQIVLNGQSLHWKNPQVDWQLNPGSFKSMDGTAVGDAAERAFRQWNQAKNSGLDYQRLSDTELADYRAKTHLVYYDDNNSSGFFPQGSGIVAITPIIYNTGDGSMIDADIIFNGSSFRFTMEGDSGAFDLQDVLTHEIGHMGGLDHSPVHGATMWPFVTPNQWLHRSLTEDDLSAAIVAARVGGITQMRGQLLDASGAAIRGGAVGAIRVDDGRLVASALSDSSGNWVIKGMPAGSYYLYAYPVEGYMNQNNFTGDSPVDTDFGVTFYGSFLNPQSYVLNPGSATQSGSLTTAPDAAVRDSFRHATIIEQGQSKQVSVFGSNFLANQTDLVEFSPFLTLTGQLSNSGMASARVVVAPNCPVGSYDLFLSLANGEIEVVPGALNVVAPAPQVNGLTQTGGDIFGGDQLIVEGSGFQDGAYVLFGGREAKAVQFMNSGQLGVVTPPGDGGLVAVIVQNPDGQDGPLEDAYRYSSIPQYEALFPRAGSLSGGTEIRITGTGFSSGMSLSIDGNPAVLTSQSNTFLTAVTPPGQQTGSVDIVMTSAEGVVSTYSNIYTYVDAPDPNIASFTPKSGKDGGGTEVNMFGANFASGAKVRFGVDPVTAQGGRYAGGIQFVDATELQSTSPSGSPGEFGVVIELPNGQGALAGSTFLYQPSASGGGGCGGVATGLDPGQPEDAYGFLLLISGWWLLQSKRRRRDPIHSGLN
jgi:matrixin/IPT/TIG domain-containing protein